MLVFRRWHINSQSIVNVRRETLLYPQSIDGSILCLLEQCFEKDFHSGCPSLPAWERLVKGENCHNAKIHLDKF